MCARVHALTLSFPNPARKTRAHIMRSCLHHSNKGQGHPQVLLSSSGIQSESTNGTTCSYLLTALTLRVQTPLKGSTRLTWGSEVSASHEGAPPSERKSSRHVSAVSVVGKEQELISYHGESLGSVLVTLATVSAS